MLPHWSLEAAEAYRVVCRAGLLPEALRRLGAADPAALLDAINLIASELRPLGVPAHLRKSAEAIGATIDELNWRLDADPSLLPASASEIAALAEHLP